MERLRAKRSEQIERVVSHTSGTVGDLRGLIGSSMAENSALEVNDAPLLKSVDG